MSMNVLRSRRIALYVVVLCVLLIVGLFTLEGWWGPERTADIVEMFRVVRDEPSVASGVVVPEAEPSGNSTRRKLKRTARQGASFEEQLRKLENGEDAEGGGAQSGEESSGPYVGLIEDSSRKSDSAPLPTEVPSEQGQLAPNGMPQSDNSQDSQNNPLGFLGGVVVRQPAPEIVDTPVATPITGRPWVRGQARGYTMLSAMQLEARPVVEANVETLLAARVREPYIGVLIDGTFGRDFAYLREIIERLSIEGRALTLALYLTNGATMRKWRETPIDALFTRINPSDFRQRIRRDKQLQAQFLAVVLQAKSVFEYNVSLNPGNTNVAIVMLEDNLDSLAYRTMREIASAELGSLAGFIRNPCFGCYEGNDDITLGDPREEHQLARYTLLERGDAYSLDGVGFAYPDGSGSGLAPAQLRDLMRNSYARGLRYVGLWRHAWQGLVVGGGNPRPDTRNYVASDPDQQEFEIEMLREGLIVEVEPQDESDL